MVGACAGKVDLLAVLLAVCHSGNSSGGLKAHARQAPLPVACAFMLHVSYIDATPKEKKEDSEALHGACRQGPSAGRMHLWSAGIMRSTECCLEGCHSTGDAAFSWRHQQGCMQQS